MKKLLTLALGIVIITGAAMAQKNEMASISKPTTTLEKAKLPVFRWESMEFNFENIPHGQPVSKVFTFDNTGEAPLIISNVQSSCGCTVADYSKEAILPGKSGYVKLTYNAANKGAFNKVVTITANTEPNVVLLHVKGNVN